MKRTLFNIVVLLFFSASIVIGCMQTKAQKHQNVATDVTKEMSEPSATYKDVEGKLIKLNSLLKQGLITEDEYYKIRAKILEKF